MKFYLNEIISRQRIKDALNAQTYEQFLQYAQQQYPGNFDQQAILIRQLQDQHYQQYIQQLAVDQRLATAAINDELIDKENDNINKDEAIIKDCNFNENEVVTTVDNKYVYNLLYIIQLVAFELMLVNQISKKTKHL